MELPEASVARHLAAFRETGFCVLPELLAADEVERVRAAFARHRAQKPANWTSRGADSRGGPTGESGRWQTNHGLRVQPDEVGFVARHPAVLQLVAALIGDSARFRSLGCMLREPVLEPPPAGVPEAFREQGIHWQLWHREAGGAHRPDHPLCIPSLQVIAYFDDCNRRSHCFSIVPETVEHKRGLPTGFRLEKQTASDRAKTRHLIVDPSSPTGSKSMWQNVPLAGREDWPLASTGVDVVGKAGTVIIQNNHNLHSGTVRQSERPRRTIHCVYHNLTDEAVATSLAPAQEEKEEEGGSPAATTAAAQFLAQVPEHQQWMFDSQSLQNFYQHDEPELGAVAGVGARL